MGDVVLGGDLGGTTTRVVVVDLEGAVLGRGLAGGGNPISNPDTSSGAFAEALGRALEGVDPVRVRTAVVGVAGGGALQAPDVRERFARAWSSAGLTCVPDYRSDLEVAFASGSPEPSGSVLIAGTGAVAGVVSDHRLGRTADGHGWLLGDDGSGFWMGREAVRATLRTLESGEAPGSLARSVLEHLGPEGGSTGESTVSRLVHAVYGRAPIRLAELAPRVTAAYAEGDPVAVAIVEEAARLLAACLARAGTGESTVASSGPVVLAGSLTRETSPVGVRLRELLSGSLTTPPVTATDEVVGAAWLALLATGPDGAAPRGAWERLTQVTITDRSIS